MTHHELVERAKRWLARRSGVVVGEVRSFAGESPDAIGYNHLNSTLIECKTSRKDFLKDKKKAWRIHPEMGMGTYRYYLCPPGIINPSDLPRNWGLLWVYPKTIKTIVKAEAQPSSEYSLMYSLIRRAILRGYDPNTRFDTLEPETAIQREVLPSLTRS